MEAAAALQALVQRVEVMEKNWADFGYPVEVSNGTEPSLKKVKLEEGAASPNENENALLEENVTARIAVLEEQWKKHFGDIPLEEPTNSNLEPTLSKASVFPRVRLSRGERKALRMEREQNDTRTPLSVFKCPECAEESINIPDMKAHVASAHAHPKSIFPCPTCGICFYRGRDRRTHARRTHLPRCAICQSVFKHEVGLEEHMRVIHGFKNGTTCSECGEELGSIKLLAAHLQDHEKTTGKTLLFRCTLCRKARYFESDELRVKHEAEDHSVACPLCGEKFISFAILRAHRRAQHKDINSAPAIGEQVNEIIV